MSSIFPTHPLSLSLSGILTPAILCVDECFSAPGTQEIEAIGCTALMKYGGLFFNKIRPASHLRAGSRDPTHFVERRRAAQTNQAVKLI